MVWHASHQGSNQDLETAWLLKIGNYQLLGCPIFQERPQYTHIATIDMCLSNEIKHNVHKQCHGSYIAVKRIQLYA